MEAPSNPEDGRAKGSAALLGRYGSSLGSSYNTSSLLTTNWSSLAGNGTWAANHYHRWGWSHGPLYCGSLRVGFSGDVDSSDSGDSYIGFGINRVNFGSVPGSGVCGGNYPINFGSGYFHHPWNPQPSPQYDSLRGFIGGR